MPSATPAIEPNTAETSASPILLQSIQLSNLLSFGTDTPTLELHSLNVLVGANGSGKSNLIDAIALLRSAPGDMAKVIRDGGGVQEWIYKGESNKTAVINTNARLGMNGRGISHHIEFRDSAQSLEIIGEELNVVASGTGDKISQFLYNSHDTRVLDLVIDGRDYEELRKRNREDSVLHLLRDPVNHPEITYLANQYERIRIYREWQFGRNAIIRGYVDGSLPQATLAEDFSNLALFLNRLCRDPKTKKTILSCLRDLYDGIDDIGFDIVGGFVQLYIVEGNHTIPAKRLSDGTLHYLCLLAILCDPNPPPLICIEEPELGLHPDILPGLADLLVDAATRTQLIVTTHSHLIVDCMTDRPDAVLICEKRDGQTHIERLDPEHLKIWLDKYSLGELWTSGELGGKRW